MLEEHNKYRKLHGSPDLVLNQTMSFECKKHSEAHTEENWQWHLNDGCGENLCLTFDDPVSCVKRWYDEGKNYNYFKGGADSAETAHFSQVVWKSTKYFGAGKYQSADGLTFVVARYKPAGNVRGKYKKNVLKPKNCSCVTYDSSTYLTIFCWIFIALFGPGLS